MNSNNNDRYCRDSTKRKKYLIFAVVPQVRTKKRMEVNVHSKKEKKKKRFT